MRCTAKLGLAGLLGLIALAFVTAEPMALDVSGVYHEARLSQCRSWDPSRSDCVSEGCWYQPQITMTPPNSQGMFNITMAATSTSCYTGSRGPYPNHVDQCARVIGGAMWEVPGGGHSDSPPSFFDPAKIHQEMDLVILGDVLGFNGGPVGFRHSTIMRRNITICSSDDFVAGTCTIGAERFICSNSFAYCSSGDCNGKNKDQLSPWWNEFFARLSTTALNGTYDLVTDKSSPDCPRNISAWHYGTQLGFGYAPHDMHLTRLVDNSLSGERGDCIQFHSECDGLQMHFEKAYAGRVYQDGSNLHLSMHIIKAETDSNNLLAVDRCEFKSRNKAPEMVRIVPDKEGAVIGLSITLTLFILGAAGLGCCCLSYRRRYIESKIDRAYDVFQS